MWLLGLSCVLEPRLTLLRALSLLPCLLGGGRSHWTRPAPRPPAEALESDGLGRPRLCVPSSLTWKVGLLCLQELVLTRH